MFKILKVISGPYEDEGLIWNVCEVEQDGQVIEEEIYYDLVDEAYADIAECGAEGIVDEYDEYLDEELGE